MNFKNNETHRLSPEKLADIVHAKNLEKLHQIFGSHENLIHEIASMDEEMRVSWFGINSLSSPRDPSFFRILFEIWSTDRMLQLLGAAASISLSISFFRFFSGSDELGGSWVEGIAILIAVLAVSASGAFNEYRREIKFADLYEKISVKDEVIVENFHFSGSESDIFIESSYRMNAEKEVTTDSDRLSTLCLNPIKDFSHKNTQEPVLINVSSDDTWVLRKKPLQDLTVGDIVHLSPGDIVPADGIMLSKECFLAVDESMLTGESDPVDKNLPQILYPYIPDTKLPGLSENCPHLPREPHQHHLHKDDDDVYQNLLPNMAAFGLEDDSYNNLSQSIFLEPIDGGNNLNTVDLNSNLNSQAPDAGVSSKNNDVLISKLAINGSSNPDIINSSSAIKKEADPFLFGGTRVVDGLSKMIILAVGQETLSRRMESDPNSEPKDTLTPMQCKLNDLAKVIAKLGICMAVVLFLVIIFKNLASKTLTVVTALSALIEAATLLVVAVPEGLPMAVNLALSFATHKLYSEGILARSVASCETMGVVTSLCTDKTGTLTENCMRVVRSTLLPLESLESTLSHHPPIQSSNNTHVVEIQVMESFHDEPSREAAAGNSHDFSTSLVVDEKKSSIEPLQRQFFHSNDLHPEKIKEKIGDDHMVQGCVSDDLVRQAIALNTGAKYLDDDGWVGSGTEIALIEHFFKSPSQVSDIQKSFKTISTIPFNSQRKFMASVVMRPHDASHELMVFCKGAAEVVLPRCSWMHYIDEKDSEQKLKPLDERKIKRMIHSWSQVSEGDATGCLRVILIAYRSVQEKFMIGLKNSTGSSSQSMHKNQSNPSTNTPQLTMEDVDTRMAQSMTLLGVIALEDPIRLGVEEAVQTCRKAGVMVRMITGDAMGTARAIATRTGILDFGGLVMDGPSFRRLDCHRMWSVIPRLQVLARASPFDKKLLVEQLRMMGEIVAVTGDGANDGPAMRAANVSFAMGQCGTPAARKAASIVLLDDNFRSIVSALSWGRCVRLCVQRFIQFQLTVNVAAVIISVYGAFFSISPIISTVQFLWINVIMDSLAALSLASDPPYKSILDKSISLVQVDSLISRGMRFLILSQASFHVLIVMMIPKIIKVSLQVQKTIQFNVFVLLELFNEVNCRLRGFSEGLNPLRNISKNLLFPAIWVATVLMQILIVTFGSIVFSTTSLTIHQWLLCVVISSSSILVVLFLRILHMLAKSKKPNELNIHLTRHQLRWEGAIGTVRRSLMLQSALKMAPANETTIPIDS